MPKQRLYGLLLMGTMLSAASFTFAKDPKNTFNELAESTSKLKPEFSSMSPIPEQPKEETDIYFSADSVENNQEQETVTATGNVEIIRENMTLKADKVVYNQRKDIITALGNVVLLEESGNVVFSDYMELTDKMTRGQMSDLKIILSDKSRISASRFRQGKNKKKIMENVTYSPCDVCSAEESPFWQIKAKKIEHDAVNQNVNYQNAWVEVKGTPVFYTPFLSHPDPTVKRRSGFLFPRISSNSYLGGAIQPRYFISVSDQEDILLDPILSTDKGVVLSGAYNKYFYRGDVNASGSYLRDPDSKESRGNLFMNARYEVNDFWVADTEINYASDSAYLKDLSLPKRDDAWLTSRASLQGFDNRNYAALETYYYTLLSYDLQDVDKPTVFPIFTYENISNPNSYGLYNKNSINFASVTRDHDIDSRRVTLINSWNLPYTSPYGEKYKFVASVKSDGYYVNNYNYNGDDTYSGASGRIFPQAGVEWRLPFVRATETSRQILEPIVVAVAAPDSSNKVSRIPNEDSQDVELNDTNILDLDRYAGYDRNDTGSRVSYGVNWSSYGERFGRTSLFLAQSYQFNKEQSFTEAEDQSGKFTDYVGRAYASPNEYLDLNYRFKLDQDNLSLKYNELSATFGPEILKAYVSYIYFQSNNASSLDYQQDRKELYTSLSAKLTKDWSISLYNRQDLTDNGGSLEHGGSLDYEDECTKLMFIIRKDNSSDPNYEGDFEMSLSFFLKTLGGVGSK